MKCRDCKYYSQREMYPLQGYCEYDKRKYGRSTCDRDERNGWKDACYKSERKEELDKEPYIPVQCVDGSCPMALADEYEERGMDVVHSCEECGYDDKKVIEHDGWKIRRNQNDKKQN